MDDSRFAGTILVWLAACLLVLPRFPLLRVLPPMILFADLVQIVVESALRRSRQRS